MSLQTNTILDIIYELLTGNAEIMALVDPVDGIRKRAQKLDKKFDTIIEYGDYTLSVQREGNPRRWAQTIQLRCLSNVNEMIVADLCDILHECLEVTGIKKNNVTVHYIVYDSFTSPEYEDIGIEAWRKDTRYRVIYSINK